VGAFFDDKVREVLPVDERYRPLYIMPVGKPVGVCSGLVVPHAKDDEYTYQRNIDYGAQSEGE
jgi:hypothetical protein